MSILFTLFHIWVSKLTRNYSDQFHVKGYLDWVNVSSDVRLYDKSFYHIDSKLALIRWNTGNQRIDKYAMGSHNYWVQHNRAVLSVVIDCVRYLTTEMLAF